MRAIRVGGYVLFDFKMPKTTDNNSMATICKTYQSRIEETFWTPFDDWIKTTEQKCEEYDWWNPIGWFCWLVTIFVKVVKWAARIIVTIIFRTICEIVNLVANAVAAVVNFVLTLPLIGPIIKAAIRTAVTVGSYVVGLADGFARIIGIRITKHIRVHVIPLCEGDIPLANQEHLEAVMTETARIFYARAQIRVHTTFHEPIRNPPENALRLGTNLDLILDEAWLKGSWHQLQTIKLFESNIWSLLAVGHPVIVYVIREVGYDGPGTVIGASGGPFMDWIAVERDSVISQVVLNPTTGMAASPVLPFPPTVASVPSVRGMPNANYLSGGKYLIAHEICHALGLLGHANSGAGQLMDPGSISGDVLSPFQVGIIRSSAPVTFF
jgi:hypothetical protein